MDYLYSLGNILILVSLSFRKVILIRLIFSLSDLAFLGYGILAHAAAIIYWSMATLAINLVQIVFLIKDLMPQQLSEELQAIKTLFFKPMQTSDFLRVIKLSRKKCLSHQHVLIKDKPVEDLMLITKGKVYIDIEGSVLELNNYHFIGEMSYFGDGKANSTIYAREPVEFLCWSYSELQQLQKKKPALFMTMVEAMGKDLMLKMIHRNTHSPENNLG